MATELDTINCVTVSILVIKISDVWSRIMEDSKTCLRPVLMVSPSCYI